jgi:MFS family permease
MRPVGGILLGLYADYKGRKSALLLIIILMTVAIAMIGFGPTYAAIGVAAPLIIVLARLLQGLATGGEFASATSFLIETAPANRRGFYGSWQMVGQGLAVLIGALLGALILRILTPEALDSWGWRIPFLPGLIIGPVGLFIRRHLQETEAFIEARGTASIRQTFGATLARILSRCWCAWASLRQELSLSTSFCFTCQLLRACNYTFVRPGVPRTARFVSQFSIAGSYQTHLQQSTI